MKVALIPPISELDEFGKDSDMHLVLNHLLENKTYFDFYRRCGENRNWITLDNSAHEFTSGQRIEELLTNAIALRAREIVLPDTLFHAMYTVTRGREAFKFLSESELFRACSPTPRLMVVPQGHDILDWKWCLGQLLKAADAYDLVGLVTIGLSKDYEKFPGGLNYLLKSELYPLWQKEGIQTHLLGWTCNWELVDWARNYYPCVRSTDSAKPFIYARKRLRLNMNQIPPKMKRAEDYFSWSPFTPNQKEVAKHNVAAFKLAARGIRSAPENVMVG